MTPCCVCGCMLAPQPEPLPYTFCRVMSLSIAGHGALGVSRKARGRLKGGRLAPIIRLTFGKMDAAAYCLDFSFPFSVAQAFALALVSLHAL